METAATYRRNITKSRSGHYHLTLIDKRTGLKVTGDWGWDRPERARTEEEPRLVERLVRAVEVRDALSRDLHKVCQAAAEVTA